MASIDRQQNESVERMISRFRRIMVRKGTLKQLRNKMYFQKPENKRIQKIRAIYREQRRRENERQSV